MSHRFPLKEIALQAGLSLATVDRAVHGRAHVSAQTQRRVADAIAELEAQEGQLAARGRRLFVDFIVEAPKRFSHEVRAAVLAAIPGIGPAVIRPRFHFAEIMQPQTVVDILTSLKARGSSGACLKVRDDAAIRQAMATLALPMVTMFTDIGQSPNRLAYVGLNNPAAGATAAYLIAQSAPGGGTILTTQSQASFQGEGERALAFAAALPPGFRVVDATGGAGLPHDTAQQVRRAVAPLDDLVAVYSMGGGNGAVLQELDRAGLHPRVFIAHDLDAENRILLRQGRLNFVLHHDLQADVGLALNHIIAAHRLRPPMGPAQMAGVQIITPANMLG